MFGDIAIALTVFTLFYCLGRYGTKKVITKIKRG